MHRTSLVYAAIFGGLAVALGAFGAHGLERLTVDDKILHGYQTGVEYQMYHALALLATGILASYTGNSWIKWASRCFVTGIILFSGSLYLITFLKIQGSTGVRFAGPFTPLGGMFFIIGWLCLLVAVLRKK
jgi:uncharacterized membrane protein YgdD (TMEM256/DUF423 family)